MIGVELCLSPPKRTFGSLIEETGQCKALQMKKPIRSWMLAIWFQMVDFHFLTPPTKKTCHFFLFGKKTTCILYIYRYVYIMFRFHPDEPNKHFPKKKNMGAKGFSSLQSQWTVHRLVKVDGTKKIQSSDGSSDLEKTWSWQFFVCDLFGMLKNRGPFTQRRSLVTNSTIGDRKVTNWITWIPWFFFCFFFGGNFLPPDLLLEFKDFFLGGWPWCQVWRCTQVLALGFSLGSGGLMTQVVFVGSHRSDLLLPRWPNSRFASVFHPCPWLVAGEPPGSLKERLSAKRLKELAAEAASWVVGFEF